MTYVIRWVAGEADVVGARAWRARLGLLRLLVVRAERSRRDGEVIHAYRWEVRGVACGVVDGRGEEARATACSTAEHVALLYSGRVEALEELVDDAGRPAPTWARPGTVVRYRPHVGHDPWYLGQITGEPRLLGGTWVVRVGRMEAAYRNGRGGVAAAALNALEPVPAASLGAQADAASAISMRTVVMPRDVWDALRRRVEEQERELDAARIALDRAAAEVES